MSETFQFRSAAADSDNLISKTDPELSRKIQHLKSIAHVVRTRATKLIKIEGR
jgi:hypothetical protein